MMRRLLPMVISLLVLQVLVAPAALAVCAEQTVAERFAAADVVATGSVFGIDDLGDGTSEVLLDALMIYKGTDFIYDDFLVIADSNGIDTRDEDEVPFAVGDAPYLLFLRANDDDTFATSACDGTRLLGAGLVAAEQEVLGSGQTIDEVLTAFHAEDVLDAESLDDAAIDDALALSTTPNDWLSAVSDWVRDYRWYVPIGFLWNFVWSGLAAWHAGRTNRQLWFWLALLPTLGLVPIVYLITHSMRKSEGTS